VGATGDRAVDLVFEPCCRFNGRQRRDAGRLVERISHLKGGEPLPETIDKLVAHRFEEDESLGGDARLSHVGHLAEDRTINGELHFRVIENHEGVAAA